MDKTFTDFVVSDQATKVFLLKLQYISTYGMWTSSRSLIEYVYRTRGKILVRKEIGKFGES